MKVQFDKSQYSTVGRSSCLVHVQWMKDQSRTALAHSYVCLGCVFVCLWIGGGGGIAGGDLRQPSPVICKSHELYSKARSSQIHLLSGFSS